MAISFMISFNRMPRLTKRLELNCDKDRYIGGSVYFLSHGRLLFFFRSQQELLYLIKVSPTFSEFD